jgi:hypothetical protein
MPLVRKRDRQVKIMMMHKTEFTMGKRIVFLNS